MYIEMKKSRDNLVVIDELLLYWNLFDTNCVVEEIEEGGLLQLE
ncbi:hypothetical protein HanOQP8_Chr00c025g0717531 [Helianthus annuus]|nr:hypothetical protein HanOQP8_Chr00c025g0717531 [Helianthus annuus]